MTTDKFFFFFADGVCKYLQRFEWKSGWVLYHVTTEYNVLFILYHFHAKLYLFIIIIVIIIISFL